MALICPNCGKNPSKGSLTELDIKKEIDVMKKLFGKKKAKN